MPDQNLIDIDLQDDHSLLIAIAQTINLTLPAINEKLDAVNGHVRADSERITAIETTCKSRGELLKRLSASQNGRKIKVINGAGIGGGMATVAGAIVFGIGRGMGWW